MSDTTPNNIDEKDEAILDEALDVEPERDPNALYNMNGNKLGRRGLLMRGDLMNALMDELDSGTPIFKVKVSDIARRVHTSPATFWQYFSDVEECLGACLELMKSCLAARELMYDTEDGLRGTDLELAISDALFELLVKSSLVRAAISCTSTKTVGLLEDVLLELSKPLAVLATCEDRPDELTVLMHMLLSLALVSDFTEDHVFEDLENKAVALGVHTVTALRQA